MPAAQKITPELLRRRAEHNDGDLATLEELTLHQFDIEKIETIDVYCKRLKILYLQNNQITKIENLKKLKALEYLNLALNNISVIENLEGCESLKKLDLTINFIEDLECINNLVPCRELRELYLTGNPITTKSGYREYTLCTLPQLLTLDGTPITPSERIQSQQKYEEIVNLQKQLPRPELPKIPNAEELDRIDQLTKDEIAYQFQKTTSDHTIEARMTTARQLAKLRNEKETNLKNEKKNRTFKRDVYKDGKVMQCNEGKYPFDIVETKYLWILKVQISKYLDTAKIQVDLYEDHVKVVIIEKLLQIRLESPISIDRSIINRSQLTGELVIYMVKLNCNRIGNAFNLLDYEKKEAIRTNKESTLLKSKCTTSVFQDKKRMDGVINVLKTNLNICSKPIDPISEVQVEEFEDDPSVPPLV